MRKSAPINSRRDLHASSGSIWGLARVFAHESAASSQTTVKVYALDIDIQDCVDVNTQKIITCNDTWTRATRIERVTHEAILISGNEQHCILNGGHNSRNSILPSSTIIKDQHSARHLKLSSPLSQASSHMLATKSSLGFGSVFGGLGAVGGYAAAWLLASRRNRCIALTSRSGQNAVTPTIINLENVIIIATRYDASSAAETAEIEKIYLVGADQTDPSIVTINSGGVLRDAIVQRQTPGRLRAVAGPKTLGKCTPSVLSLIHI